MNAIATRCAARRPFGVWLSLALLAVGFIIEWARANGMDCLLVDGADENAPAIALYASKGFEANGEAGTFAPPRERIRERRRVLVLNGDAKLDTRNFVANRIPS